ncbi:hypothetical protein N7471_012694 [Penicillium samsonianum]|uniref:uncharacterized protein n=1 Tax=Penicillium samsonianum TaxID=1882272 RepID=UPI00254694B6|nr:uncharacterized protein N7471_012694 [Penicillium samsonianum]KAJ6125377.1 hypothetical protein N7471_012694 [Penicillium samsonianum]
MQFKLAVIALLAPLVMAENCQDGLDYCAYTLVGKGDYHQQIGTALTNYGAFLRATNPDWFLFHCDGGANGAISVKSKCPKGCVDGGDSTSDFCAPDA